MPTSGAGTTPLAAVADFKWPPARRQCNRSTTSSRTRAMLEAKLLHGDAPLGQAVAAIHALPMAKNLPPGVEIGGPATSRS